MLCQKCQKRVANIQFTQIINNNKHVVYLCDQCAREEGKFNIGSPLSINDFFSGIMGVPYMQSVKQHNSEIKCDSCKMSYNEFEKTGKIGCSDCYKAYGEKLMPLLKRLHGSVQYNGKIPGRVYSKVKVSREIRKLKEHLDACIKNEEYEKAADIRDQIKEMESKKE
ncbi:UvrB/UvrC motif-containing protein [Herbivorax sp. ANBcel31]|uniref:UvrB/UvrC motif-containing protein n=1 Tax=Herbivorax sp. ANBcel31 TaxID=3069754 RepID=UPI0027B06566|nr:UvrB/UvrC motif-containing protein [Herbivorax sp. ANBcel31]MDQ2084890.1 UvrB/UvrC motif-containing protein [Herbivorax sp. ANBcel31]